MDRFRQYAETFREQFLNQFLIVILCPNEKTLPIGSSFFEL
jgi:hypothetical protein